MYETSRQETYNFWRSMARHYAGHNTVAFFELFNEPTTYHLSRPDRIRISLGT